MTQLSKKKCIPCTGGVETLPEFQAQDLLGQLNDWRIEGTVLKKDFKFADFKSALAFVNKVGAIAEEESHHPDIELGWGRVVIRLTTHDIKGLSENDFIVAAKIDLI